MVEKQKKEEGEAYVSAVLFDDRQEVLYDRTPIRRVECMTEKQYFVRGCTAFWDAVGLAIHHIGNIHKYARNEDVPEKTIFVIITDGMENASRLYGPEKLRSMIERQQKKYNWEFLFIGANIDAVTEASRIGIQPSRAVNYVHDGRGTRLNFDTLSSAISGARAAASARPAASSNCVVGPGANVIASGNGETRLSVKSFTRTVNGTSTGATPSADTDSTPRYAPAGWQPEQCTRTQKL
jgi:hypothetical protein